MIGQEHGPLVGGRKVGNRLPWEDCRGNDCPQQCRKGSKGRKLARRLRAKNERQQFRLDLAAGVYA